MSLLGFIITVVVIGVVLWLVNTYVPMAPAIKKFLNVAVVILLVVWLLYLVLGGSGHVQDIKVPTLR
jgi:hypothetical protein